MERTLLLAFSDRVTIRAASWALKMSHSSLTRETFCALPNPGMEKVFFDVVKVKIHVDAA